ncbi:MAG: GNAT family protein [Burkholderiales bacterium]|nr:GNAT family protein [Burkholderiales bacterium]
MIPPRPRPARLALEGRYARLEPLGQQHAQSLYAACAGAVNAPRFEYLPDLPPTGVDDMAAWIDRTSKSDDPLFFAVIDRASGRCEGRQALMRIVPEHGVIELGSIYWGPAIARTRVATEAFYLHARTVFDTLGYRRFEWKCNDRNAPSKRAAVRFGFTFEGVFRQHMWVKGASRDSAWYAILDGEWPALRAEFERWLAPENFDAAGRQRSPLDAAAGARV